jgi:hypothetical protein
MSDNNNTVKVASDLLRHTLMSRFEEAQAARRAKFESVLNEACRLIEYAPEYSIFNGGMPTQEVSTNSKRVSLSEIEKRVIAIVKTGNPWVLTSDIYKEIIGEYSGGDAEYQRVCSVIRRLVSDKVLQRNSSQGRSVKIAKG